MLDTLLFIPLSGAGILPKTKKVFLLARMKSLNKMLIRSIESYHSKHIIEELEKVCFEQFLERRFYVGLHLLSILKEEINDDLVCIQFRIALDFDEKYYTFKLNI